MAYEHKQKLEEWSKILDDQKKWIGEHGGDLAGYVTRYGSRDEREHFGEGGEAIYDHDMETLLKYREEFYRAVIQSKKETPKPGTCQRCGRPFVDLQGSIKGCVIHNTPFPLNIQALIAHGVYKNTKSFPMIKNDYGGALLKEYQAEESRVIKEFHDDLERLTGMQGHPKAQAVWTLAWEDGHSSGYSEVATYYKKYADLVK
jgi:hypothetical protein